MSKTQEEAMEQWLDGMTNERSDKPAPVSHGEVSEIATMRKKMWEEIWEATCGRPLVTGVEETTAYNNIATKALRERMSRYMRDFTEEPPFDAGIGGSISLLSKLGLNFDQEKKRMEEEGGPPTNPIKKADLWVKEYARYPKRGLQNELDDAAKVLRGEDKPTAVIAASIEKTSIKEAEDKIVQILGELDEPMQNLLYRVLYLKGIRIEGAELIVRRNFKV